MSAAQNVDHASMNASVQTNAKSMETLISIVLEQVKQMTAMMER